MERAGEILKSLLSAKVQMGAGLYSPLFRGWQDIVGLSLAEHSRLYDIKNGILLVEVDHPGWLQKLQFRKQGILKRLKKVYPELEILDLRGRVTLRFSSLSPDRPVKREGRSEVDNSDQGELDRIVSGVTENDLKERLKALFVAALRREAKGTTRKGRNSSDTNG